MIQLFLALLVINLKSLFFGGVVVDPLFYPSLLGSFQGAGGAFFLSVSGRYVFHGLQLDYIGRRMNSVYLFCVFMWSCVGGSFQDKAAFSGHR